MSKLNNTPYAVTRQLTIGGGLLEGGARKSLVKILFKVNELHIL